MFGFFKNFVRREEFDSLAREVRRNADFNMTTSSALSRSGDIKELDKRMASIEAALRMASMAGKNPETIITTADRQPQDLHA